MKTLTAALHAFQADAPKLHRDATNPHYRSKFISLDSLMEQVLPALNRHGLVLMQLPTTVDGAPALRTRIAHAESGEAVEDTMLLVLAKDDPQGQGSALTYARRYALMASLGLVADEDDDGNGASRPAGEPRGAASAPASSGASPADYVMRFGKHKGKTMGALLETDRQYVEWLCDMDPKTADQRAAVQAASEVLVGAVQDAFEDIPFE